MMFYAYLLPLWIAAASGAYLFYAQHSFPGARVYTPEEWEFFDAALNTASYFKLGRLMEWFTGSIGYHHVHHLNSRIPFYRLREAMEAFPQGFLHVWDGDEIVGQIEVQRADRNPPAGYVRLFYLRPAHRDRGLGAQLEAHVCDLFRSLGADHLRLSVSPTNAQAWRFYEKHGWVDLGPRDDGSASKLMEKRLDV